MLIIPKGKRGKGESISITHFIIWQEVGKAVGKGELSGSLGLFLLCVQLCQRHVEVLVFLLPDSPEPWTLSVASGARQMTCLVPQTVKNLPAMEETRVHSLGREGSPGEGNGNPVQYYCLMNSMDREAWRAAVCGVTKSQTQLSDSTIAAPD